MPSTDTAMYTGHDAISASGSCITRLPGWIRLTKSPMLKSSTVSRAILVASSSASRL